MTKNPEGFDAAFVAAQKLIGGARKTSTNPHFKSKYADLKECFNACSDILNEHGIHITQPVRTHDGVIHVRTILTHVSGETREDDGIPLHGYQNAKNPMQALGSAMTYARRYGLCSMVGIAPEDDGNSLTETGPTYITQEQVKILEGRIEKLDINPEKFNGFLSVPSLSQIRDYNFKVAMAALDKKEANNGTA